VKKMVMERLKWKERVNHDMAIALSTLEKFMRAKVMSDGLKDIKSYSLSKRLATGIFKLRGVHDK
jgi:hypothetical protein